MGGLSFGVRNEVGVYIEQLERKVTRYNTRFERTILLSAKLGYSLHDLMRKNLTAPLKGVLRRKRVKRQVEVGMLSRRGRLIPGTPEVLSKRVYRTHHI